MIRLIAAALLSALAAFPASQAQADDELYLIKESDKRMNNAFAEARKGRKAFLKLAEQRPEGFSSFMAYVQFEDGGETEYLWVADVQRYEGDYIGVIINTPQLVHHVSYGDTIRYTPGDIYDWQYYDSAKGITHGGFTTCVLLNPDKPEDMDYMKESGLQCSW